MKRFRISFFLLSIIGILFSLTIGCENNDDNDPSKTEETIFNPNLTYGTMTDVEGNEYKTITIGMQTWMAENLKTTKYNDGTAIPLVINASSWSNLMTPGYAWYDNDAGNKTSYGALYNWYTINTNKLCPAGWHIPTDADWTTLEIYLQNNGYNFDGNSDMDNDRGTNNKIAKSLASTAIWIVSTYEGSVGNADYTPYRNKTGFSALPGGYRNYDGTFHDRGCAGYWWSYTASSGTSVWNRYLAFDYSNLYRMDYSMCVGFSIRCIKDN